MPNLCCVWGQLLYCFNSHFVFIEWALILCCYFNSFLFIVICSLYRLTEEHQSSQSLTSCSTLHLSLTSRNFYSRSPTIKCMSPAWLPGDYGIYLVVGGQIWGGGLSWRALWNPFILSFSYVNYLHWVCSLVYEILEILWHYMPRATGQLSHEPRFYEYRAKINSFD